MITMTETEGWAAQVANAASAADGASAADEGESSGDPKKLADAPARQSTVTFADALAADGGVVAADMPTLEKVLDFVHHLYCHVWRVM